MAATATVQEGNGAGPTWTDYTVPFRFCTTDDDAPGSNYPCIIPSSGFNYSYWKNHRLKFVGITGSVTNVKWYCTGNPSWGLGTSGEVRIGTRDSGDGGCPTGSYDQASGTEYTTGDDLEAQHSYYSGQTNKSDPVGTYLTGSRFPVHTAAITGDPDYTNHVVLQVKIDTAGNGASAGEKSDVTFTFAYDEV